MQPAKNTDQNAGSRLLASLEDQLKTLIPESDPLDKIALKKSEPISRQKGAKQ